MSCTLLGSFSNSHFDGVLDFHSGREAPMWFFLVLGLVDVACIGVPLYIVGAVMSRSKVRPQDVLGTQALARWPTVFPSLVALLPGLHRQTARLGVGDMTVVPIDIAAFALAMIVMLVATVWMVALMYRGFAVSCNVRGPKAWTAFVVVFIAAEVASKIVVLFLVKAL